MEPPYISLIVATLGRTEELQRLLYSLQNESEQIFEVIVVDQNNDERIAPVLMQFANCFTVQHIRLAKKNASIARNLGARHANGQWLAFPDDDCCYTGNTLASAKKHINTRHAGLITGAILDFDKQFLSKSLRTSCKVALANIRGKITEPAMFIRKNVFDELGGFDENFGPGSPNFAGEALELGIRALKSKINIIYSTDIEVLHARSIPPYNMRAMEVGYRYSYANGLAIVRHYPVFAYYFLAKQAGFLPLRNLVKNYQPAKKAYYNACLKGLYDGIILKKSTR